MLRYIIEDKATRKSKRMISISFRIAATIFWSNELVKGQYNLGFPFPHDNCSHCLKGLSGRSDVITADVSVWLNINFLVPEVEPELGSFPRGCEDFTQQHWLAEYVSFIATYSCHVGTRGIRYGASPVKEGIKDSNFSWIEHQLVRTECRKGGVWSHITA